MLVFFENKGFCCGVPMAIGMYILVQYLKFKKIYAT